MLCHDTAPVVFLFPLCGGRWRGGGIGAVGRGVAGAVPGDAPPRHRRGRWRGSPPGAPTTGFSGGSPGIVQMQVTGVSCAVKHNVGQSTYPRRVNVTGDTQAAPGF
jgi:hypothetical protein